MSLAGMVMMVLSYGVVFGLAVFCIHRLLTTPGTSESEHSVLEIDTQDEDPTGSGTRLDL